MSNMYHWSVSKLCVRNKVIDTGTRLLGNTGTRLVIDSGARLIHDTGTRVICDTGQGCKVIQEPG